MKQQAELKMTFRNSSVSIQTIHRILLNESEMKQRIKTFDTFFPSKVLSNNLNGNHEYYVRFPRIQGSQSPVPVRLLKFADTSSLLV